MAACVSCEKRKGKRPCPALSGEICPQCCGDKREESIACPLDCDFLLECRLHEKHTVDPSIDVHTDVEISEQFLNANRSLIQLLGTGTALAALECEGAVDRDIREALDALVKSYRTLESSGLIYDNRPANPYAESIRQHMQKTIADIQEKLRQQEGMYRVSDADILRSLVVLVRAASAHNNGRARGRSFLHIAMGMAADTMSRMERGGQ